MEKYFQKFLQERPSLNLEGLMRELKNFDKLNFYAIKDGKRKIPQARRGDFYRIMKKYGYKFDFDADVEVCYFPV